MITQTRSDSSKTAKRPPMTAKKKAKKSASSSARKAAPKATSVRKKATKSSKSSSKGIRASANVSHENDLFDEESDYESPRRNPSQARIGELEEEDRPRRRSSR